MGGKFFPRLSAGARGAARPASAPSVSLALSYKPGITLLLRLACPKCPSAATIIGAFRGSNNSRKIRLRRVEA